jgi:hypothetical protein
MILGSSGYSELVGYVTIKSVGTNNDQRVSTGNRKVKNIHKLYVYMYIYIHIYYVPNFLMEDFPMVKPWSPGKKKQGSRPYSHSADPARWDPPAVPPSGGPGKLDTCDFRVSFGVFWILW